MLFTITNETRINRDFSRLREEEGKGEGIVGKKSRTGRGGNRWKIPGDFGRRGGEGEGGGEEGTYCCIGVDKLELISENKRATRYPRPREINAFVNTNGTIVFKMSLALRNRFRPSFLRDSFSLNSNGLREGRSYFAINLFEGEY